MARVIAVAPVENIVRLRNRKRELRKRAREGIIIRIRKSLWKGKIVEVITWMLAVMVIVDAPVSVPTSPLSMELRQSLRHLTQLTLEIIRVSLKMASQRANADTTCTATTNS